MVKKVISAVLSVMLVFLMVIIPASVRVNADAFGTYVKYSKNVTVYKFADDYNNSYCIKLGKRAPKGCKVSLDPSNAEVIKYYDYYDGKVAFLANKVGTTDLKIKVKKKDGTTKKYQIKITVKKYKSPVKSLKIGKKKFTKKLGNKIDLSVKLKAKKGKVSIKPKKGWKVSKITYQAYYTGEDPDNNPDINKDYKNNSLIKFKNSKDYDESLYFTMTEKSSGIAVRYRLKIKN